MERYPITQDQVRFYQENGFVQLPHMLTPEELKDLRGSLEEALAMGHPGAIERDPHSEYSRVFLQKVNLWRVHEGIRRHVFSRRIAEVARLLSGSDRVRLWHDHALIKPGTSSKPSPWHQDLPYWPMNEEGALSCWMALDDVDETNGCMQFIAGSHRFGRLPPINLVDPQDLFQYVPHADRAQLSPAVMRLKAGSCTFHNGLTFHYASANTSGRPRRAMITIYMPDGVTYKPQPHVVTDGLGLKEGDPIAGDLFPILAGE